jgi:hypothetical protein
MERVTGRHPRTHIHRDGKLQICYRDRQSGLPSHPSQVGGPGAGYPGSGSFSARQRQNRHLAYPASPAGH